MNDFQKGHLSEYRRPELPTVGKEQTLVVVARSLREADDYLKVRQEQGYKAYRVVRVTRPQETRGLRSSQREEVVVHLIGRYYELRDWDEIRCELYARSLTDQVEVPDWR